MRLFSGLNRDEHCRELSEKKFDVIVIGGGISGAGIALDAVSRGLKTALVEKCDFAWGTSSRSTKLIHGGLRYLSRMELGLVRELGRERAKLRKNARHLISPQKILVPFVHSSFLQKWKAIMGLRFYDWLVDTNSLEKMSVIGKGKAIAAEPLFPEKRIKGAGLLYEYATDDARLTIEVLKRAFDQGATILNYCEVLRYNFSGSTVTGVTVRDHIGDREISVSGSLIVNATGPWVETLRKLDQYDDSGVKLRLSKGVHIVVEKNSIPVKQAVYFENRADRRMIFVIPKRDVVYIGTTDEEYSGPIDQPTVNSKDVEYILSAINDFFNVNIEVKDIRSSWAGLRPLLDQSGKKTDQLPRKDELFISPSKVISVAGGKLTGYRKMAERAVDEVIKTLDLKTSQYGGIGKSMTAILKLSGGEFDSDEQYLQARKEILKNRMIKLEDHVAFELFDRYGSNSEIIISKAAGLVQEGEKASQALLKAELWYGIEYEMVHHLSDFLIRRTGKLYFDRPKIRNLYPMLLDELTTYYQWDEAEKEKVKQDFLREYKTAVSFK